MTGQDDLDATLTMIVPGARLGPYRLDAKIGAGGMGEVYRAHDTRLRRNVAIKLLLPDKTPDQERRNRLLREARAASALNHPNIVVLHDIAAEGQNDYLVMEYVEGETLCELISKEELPEARIAAIGSQVASALAAAHAAGLVHRDIKAANIMVTPRGAVKVLDFGIAKSIQGALPLVPESAATNTMGTSSGMIVGTVAYMSPEQTRGEETDGRSDLFSLGVVLYEAATGRLPFEGKSAIGLMHAIATAEPVPVGSLRPGFSPRLAGLVAKCLAKLPEQWPASAADLAVELRSLSELGARPVGERPAVAVIPFLLRGATAEEGFLSVALADAVIHRLGSSDKLLVRPTVSVMRYGAKEANYVEVARGLNVDFVVDGSIQKEGTKIRLLVRAWKAGDAQAFYSAKLDGNSDDLFGLQDRLSEAVAAALLPSRRTEPVCAENAVGRAPNPIAHELFMRAAERVTRVNKWDTQAAIEMLTRATDIDPTFTEAWARLAQAAVQMGVIFDNDPRWFRLAEDAVARTLALDIGHADALCARGQILWSPHHSYQNRQALRALNGALKLNPGCHQAQIWRGLILFHLGLYEEAKRGLEEALARNPEESRAMGFLAQTALYKGDYEEAYELDSRALRMDPASIWPNLFFPTISLYLGRPGEAAEKLRIARKMVPEEPTLLSVEAMIAAHAGDFRKAEILADEALTFHHSLLHSHHLWHNAASAYAMCGLAEKAVPLLRRCAEMGLPNYGLFRRDPHLAALQGNSDFETMMASLRVEYDVHRAEFGDNPNG